ncbi:MAG: type II secretion system protein GspF, partial [Candidatus Colwellbacteria bacterium CG23_combo_of_CG06-09_8_20_14_all_42_19]
IDNTLKTLVSLLEPILVISMGAIVALIAVSVLLPIYRLSSGFL